MVNYVLKITADLENLTNLQPSGGCDDPNFPYLFKVSFIFTSLDSFHRFVYLCVYEIKLIILLHSFEIKRLNFFYC